MTFVLGYVGLVIITAGLPLAHWSHQPWETPVITRLVYMICPLLLLAVCAVFMAKLHTAGREARRAEARHLERQARPPNVVVPAAIRDELELYRAALRNACCTGTWTADRTYAHHPECTRQETDHA